MTIHIIINISYLTFDVLGIILVKYNSSKGTGDILFFITDTTEWLSQIPAVAVYP